MTLLAGLTHSGCDDPPADPVAIGGIIFMMRTFPATSDPDLTAIDHISMLTDHVEVVHSGGSAGEEHITVDSQSRLITLNNREETKFLAQYPIPVGSVSQIRVFPKEVTVALKDGSVIELSRNGQLPSLEQSGWKVTPVDGQPWTIIDNELTGVRALFQFDERMLFNHGLGYKLKPTVPAETFEVNPSGDSPGLFVDRIMVAFQAGVSRAEVDAINAEIGATVYRAPHITTTYVMKLPPTKNLQDAVEFYHRKPQVAWSFPAMNIAPADFIPNEGIQDSQSLAKLPAAWDHLIATKGGFALGDRTILIAVIDSGIDVTHPDIAFNIAINQGEIPPDLGVVDADGDGIITFVDLNSAVNLAVLPPDVNGNGYRDGEDLIKDPKWANGIDDDNNCVGLGQNPNPDKCIDDLVGWNIHDWSNDSSPNPNALDKSFHGTFVAGIIGAEGNNGPGAQAWGIAGALWRLQIIPIRIDSGGPKASAEDSDIVEGMVYASRRGAHIANLSYGGIIASDAADTSCLNNLKELLKNNQAGIPHDAFESWMQFDRNLFFRPDLADMDGNVFTNTLFVISAGNEAANLADLGIFGFPSEAAKLGLDKHVLVVGATKSDEPLMSDFSNYGSPVVELFAPGEDWKSLFPWVPSNGACAPEDDDACTLSDKQGTSFSAPLVSGIGGLALVAFPSLRGDAVGLYAHLINTSIASVAQDVSCSPQSNQLLVDAHEVVSTIP